MTSGRGGTLLAWLAVLTFGLTGCRISGDVDVNPDAAVNLDLLVTELDDGVECAADNSYWDLQGIKVEDATAPDGSPACRVTGTPNESFVQASLVNLGVQGDYVVLDLGSTTPESWIPEGDVQVQFPGEIVLSTAGEADGDRVHLLWDEKTSFAQRVLIVSRPAQSVAGWLLPTGVGLGIATVSFGLGLLVGRRGWRFSGDSAAALSDSGPAGPGKLTLEVANPDPILVAVTQPRTQGEAAAADLDSGSPSPATGKLTQARRAAARPAPADPGDDTFWAPPGPAGDPGNHG